MRTFSSSMLGMGDLVRMGIADRRDAASSFARRLRALPACDIGRHSIGIIHPSVPLFIPPDERVITIE